MNELSNPGNMTKTSSALYIINNTQLNLKT